MRNLRRRLFLAAFVWLALASGAQACLGTNLHRGVVFEEVPWDAPPNALILRVEFDGRDVRRIAGPRPTSPMDEWLLMMPTAVDARVVEVVRGEYSAPTVRVAIGGSSCDSPFIFGRRGLIMGEFVTPSEGQARYDAAVANHPGNLAFRWPFTETVFDAITETRDGRDMRHAGLSRTLDGPLISGDYDGDGHTDTAQFFEDREGALIIGVQSRARREVRRIWSGDLSSFERFTFRTAPPGLYRTACHLYGEDCGGAPREISLTHEGIIVTALEGSAEYLYYWDGETFQNVIISE